MSRYSEGDYDEEFPNAGALWEANARRALKGKRGRKALADLRDALLALPRKALIEGSLCTVGWAARADALEETWERPDFTDDVLRQGEGVCAVGAYLWWQKVKAGTDPDEAFAALPTQYGGDGSDTDITDTAAAGRAAGLVYSLAYELAYRNDEEYRRIREPDGKYRLMTPEERYGQFMAWLDTELAPVAAVSAPQKEDQDA